MARYIIKDLEWVRGSTPLNIFRFNTITSEPGAEPVTRTPLVFDDARVSVYAGKTFLFRLSIVEGTVLKTDIDTGEIQFRPTAQQTKMLKESALGDEAKNSYEIELRNGPVEDVYVMGALLGTGGRNDDEGTI